MILADVRNYLEQRGEASLSEIAHHFDTPPMALRGMLALWMRKDIIHKRAATPSCGSSCTQCDAATTEIYGWGPAVPAQVNLAPTFCTISDNR